MTRIIAGFAGSLAIATPGPGTRPTSDRVREAIFSSLDARDAVSGMRVLDLYAGSGALGLEAASRGARRVVLVERHPAAARICRENVRRILKGIPDDDAPDIRVAAQSVQSFLDADDEQWDVALLDPPYDLPEPELAAALAALAPRLAKGALVLVERSSRSPEPVWPTGLAPDRRRDYGDTALWWAHAPEP